MLKAIAVLLDNMVKEENLVLLTLFVAPRGAARILSTFPKVRQWTSSFFFPWFPLDASQTLIIPAIFASQLTLVTSEIATDCRSIDFSERYFGTH